MRSAVLLLWVVGASGCFFAGDPAGEGDKARAGFQQAAAILVAIESHWAKEGAYPDSLGQLVPSILSPSQLALQVPGSGAYPFEYERLGDGYRLTFQYTGPGMNVCTFERSVMAWDCFGYF